MKHTLWLALLLSFVALPARAQTEQTVEEPRFKVNAVEISIAGRVQTEFNTTTVEEEPYTEWLLRRVRLSAKVRVNDVVSGKVQPEFAGGRISVKDAYLELNFAPGFQVLAGKAFRPFGLLPQLSSTQHLPIEPEVRIRGLTGFDEFALVSDSDYAGRGVGLQVMGRPGWAPWRLAYAAAYLEGPLGNDPELIGDEDDYQLAARVTAEPLDQLRIGAGWSRRDFVGPAGFVSAEPLEERVELRGGSAYEVDVEYGSFSPGFHLLAEVSFGDQDPFQDQDFWGADAWLGYRTGPLSETVEHLESIFRASYGDPDGLLTGGTLLTPGINVYFGGRNRVQLNYDVWLPEDESDPEGNFKTMFQLHF
jgi:hypothetical protein